MLQAPLTHRLEAVRAHLAHRLGDALFSRLYRAVCDDVDSGKAPSRAAATMVAVLGDSHAVVIPLVFHLMELEQRAYVGV